MLSKKINWRVKNYNRIEISFTNKAFIIMCFYLLMIIMSYNCTHYHYTYIKKLVKNNSITTQNFIQIIKKKPKEKKPKLGLGVQLCLAALMVSLLDTSMTLYWFFCLTSKDERPTEN